MPRPPKYEVRMLTIRPWFNGYLPSILILVLYCLISLLNSISIYGHVNLGLHLDNPLHHHAVVTRSDSSSSSCPFHSHFLPSFLSYFLHFSLYFFVFLYFFFELSFCLLLISLYLSSLRSVFLPLPFERVLQSEMHY